MILNGNGNGWRKWIIGALTAAVMTLGSLGVRHILARIDANEAAWKDITKSRDERTSTLAEFRFRLDRLEEESRMRRSR